MSAGWQPRRRRWNERAAVWADAKLPAALEPRRARALALIDAELAALRGTGRM